MPPSAAATDARSIPRTACCVRSISRAAAMFPASPARLPSPSTLSSKEFSTALARISVLGAVSETFVDGGWCREACRAGVAGADAVEYAAATATADARARARSSSAAVVNTGSSKSSSLLVELDDDARDLWRCGELPPRLAGLG